MKTTRNIAKRKILSTLTPVSPTILNGEFSYSLKYLWHRHMTDERKFTCVALHKEKVIMATGDISGRILILHDFVNRVRPVKTVYHWHTLAVNSVCFSSEGLFILRFPFYYCIFNFCFPNHLGEYLYSGGSENVMVKWRLGMSRKQCLPRMGSSIKFIVNAPDNICVATSHFDNGS